MQWRIHRLAEAVNIIINVIQPPQVFIPVFVPLPILVPRPVEIPAQVLLPVLQVPRRHYIFRAIDTRLTGAIAFSRACLAVEGAVWQSDRDGTIEISARGSRYQRPVIKAACVIKKVVSTANNGSSSPGGRTLWGIFLLSWTVFGFVSQKKMIIIVGIDFLVFMTFLSNKKILCCYQNYVNKHKNNWVFKVYPLYKKVALRYQILIALHNTYVVLFLHYHGHWPL